MRDARNIRDGGEFESTAEEAIMAEFGLTPEQLQSALAQFEGVDVVSIVNATGALPPDEGILDNVPCTTTFDDYAIWHSSVGAISDVNTDYQLYVSLCQAKGENWIPRTAEEQIKDDSNNTLIKTGLLLGGAFIVYKSLFKK